jgi:hypothetical protein
MIGQGQEPRRGLAKFGAFVAVVMLALSVPAMAFAATASFTSKTPVPGSSSLVKKPTLSVIAYDKYGVTGTHYWMKLDGTKVAVKITRFSGWGTRKFMLSFAVPTNLSVGTHTVAVRVSDARSHISDTSWSFTVDAPPATTSNVVLNYVGLANITLTATNADDTFYILDGGPVTLYTGPINVTSTDAYHQQHTLEYWSVDENGNVETHHMVPFLVMKTFAMNHALPTLAADSNCVLSGCHGQDHRTSTGKPTTIADIHNFQQQPTGTILPPGCAACHSGDAVVTSDCSLVACHGPNGPHGDTGPGGTGHVAIASVPTTPGAPVCTQSGCHVEAGVVAIHNGQCALCHGSTDTNVVAVIAAGGATCEDCHDQGFTDIHSLGNAPHATVASDASTSCVGVNNACHAFPSVVTIHATQLPGGPTPQGCVTCHNPGIDLPASAANCQQSMCHPTGLAVHGALPASHVTTNTCASGNNAAQCHASNVATIHTTRPAGSSISIPGCAACHANGVTPSNNCSATGCHDGVAQPLNPHAAITLHTGVASNVCFTSGCHNHNVSVIHDAWIDPPGCAACHAAGVTASTTCATAACHPNEHAHQDTDHASALPAGCISAGCHAAGTTPTTVDLGLEHNLYGVVCIDCHNSSDERVIAAIENHTNKCIDCHSGTGSNPNLNSDFHGFEFLNPANASGHNIAGNSIGAKTRFDGTQGVTLRWEALETTTLAGFADGRNGSYVEGETHTVTTQWDFPTANVFWASTDASAPVSATKGLTAASIVTCSGVNGCHDAASGINASGPHGSTQTWDLDPNYPGDYSYAELTKYVTANLAYVSSGVSPLYNTPLSASGIAMFPGAATGADITSAAVASTATVPGWVPGVTALGNRTDGTKGATAVICAKCHDLENLNLGGVDGTGAIPTVEGANTAHDSHHQDQLDGSPQCVNCHVGIPHGWKMPRLLVDSDVDSAPYLDPQMVGTTRATSTGDNTGNTTKLTAGFGQGFNGQGMQALSGVNNHVLGGPGGVQPYATGTGLAEPSLNFAHNGMAYWAEPQCQACGDHSGETPAQIINEPAE